MKFENLLLAFIKSRPCYEHITDVKYYNSVGAGWLCSCAQVQDYLGPEEVLVEMTEVLVWLWQPREETNYSTMSVEMLESHYCMIKTELRNRGRL